MDESWFAKVIDYSVFASTVILGVSLILGVVAWVYLKKLNHSEKDQHQEIAKLIQEDAAFAKSKPVFRSKLRKMKGKPEKSVKVIKLAAPVMGFGAAAVKLEPQTKARKDSKSSVDSQSENEE